MIERLARIPVEVDYGSEFRYRSPIIAPKTLTIVITQSGETADTLAAQREAKSHGSKTLAICNVVGSAVTRGSGGQHHYSRGSGNRRPRRRRAFTTQLTALYILALHLGRLRGTIDDAKAAKCIQQLLELPGKIEQVLAQNEQYEELAKRFFRSKDFLFLGHAACIYPIALEGALKLKEISYIHAEGYPAGEMKHGPNALIDENLPVVVLATCDPSDEHSVTLYEKTCSNIKEVKARDGIVITIATEGHDEEVRESSDAVITVPVADELLSTILEIVPLQLLAYHIAVRRGCDVDQPRNLAKSVTVE